MFDNILKKWFFRLKKRKYSLKQLLDAVTEDNLHSEVDTGDAVGKEIW